MILNCDIWCVIVMFMFYVSTKPKYANNPQVPMSLGWNTSSAKTPWQVSFRPTLIFFVSWIYQWFSLFCSGNVFLPRGRWNPLCNLKRRVAKYDIWQCLSFVITTFLRSNAHGVSPNQTLFSLYEFYRASIRCSFNVVALTLSHIFTM